MRNEAMEKALEETWKNKERFYEDTKGLSMLEIIKNIENKYKERGTSHNRTVYAQTEGLTPPVGGSAYEKTQSG
ncbi:hypothetical protein AGMMS50293_30110 [Spirochaetia bacterium]|nr:hypothetical protein AGMMS50293_30110 [Spirochaetia bacterium]